MLCQVQAIGFDMDYTLSQYRPETFEVLAYNLTITKLVNNFKYPKAGLPLLPFVTVTPPALGFKDEFLTKEVTSPP